ncbi:unnamed protein product [Enterobius vermicularis]|uniref:Secreted protein n=1 Tax=Enterobius vermicularis TaxID=51028 RepID=A0A0N4UW69_ENTVE|nr:unnamed protein product [Enterobius vermicularis]
MYTYLVFIAFVFGEYTKPYLGPYTGEYLGSYSTSPKTLTETPEVFTSTASTTEELEIDAENYDARHEKESPDIIRVDTKRLTTTATIAGC